MAALAESSRNCHEFHDDSVTKFCRPVTLRGGVSPGQAREYTRPLIGGIMKLSYGVAAVMALTLTALPMQAQGVVVIQKETSGGQSTTSRVQMDKDHIRAEARDNGDETAFVYDGPKQTAR